jgi:hypothetical protein
MRLADAITQARANGGPEPDTDHYVMKWPENTWLKCRLKQIREERKQDESNNKKSSRVFSRRVVFLHYDPNSIGSRYSFSRLDRS